MSFAHLLRKSGDKGKYDPDDEGAHDEGNDDTGLHRVKDDSVKKAKHAVARKMIDAMKEGDHEALSGSLEDWHELHGASGAQAAQDPEDTRTFHDEGKYKLGKDSDGRRD
jgi:hypothetical protein